MQLKQRLLARLLHYANSNPPWNRNEFYNLKERLLWKHGTFRGHELQEIRKECWGPWGREYGERIGCQGEKCSQCGGTGVFDIRWVRLERWEWCGYVFHRPLDDTRIPPAVGSVSIFGRIQHTDYGRASREAVLWLYLLCGEWRLLWKTLTSSASAYTGLWPFLRLQRVCFLCRMNLDWKKCHCGRWYPTWGKGWLFCPKCRNPKPCDDEIPF